MTTAELVNLVVSRLDSMEANHADFRKEVRRDVSEIKALARATNGRVTELERQKIREEARLEERTKVDREQAADREKKAAPVRQVLISVVAGVLLGVSLAGLNQIGVI